MFGGLGYFTGSTVLITGTAGTGKTTLASHFAESLCKRGERCLYVCFEESPSQLSRNMKSVGINLERYEREGLLQFQAARPTVYGHEVHLAMLQRCIRQFKPSAVVLDPISGLVAAGTESGASAMMVRMLDFMKSRGVTSVLTSLIGTDPSRDLDIGVSSLVDTWILLQDTELDRGRTHWLSVLKSPGHASLHPERRHIVSRRMASLCVAPSPRRCGSGRMRAPMVSFGVELAMEAQVNSEVQKSSTEVSQERWELRLYVAGQTARSLTAFANLKRICEEHLEGRYSIEVIDIVERPQLAKDEQIFALPTLIRRLPSPMRKIVGDLSNAEHALVGLQLRPKRQ